MSALTAKSELEIVRDPVALGARVDAWHKDGLTVGLVPTMGALHRGHGTLMEAASGACDRVVVSIFVNPTQFGPNEDFAAYPRDETADIAFLESAGVDLLYAPDVAALYPDGLEASVHAGALADNLCGAHRPGHFDGVATVVARLLEQAKPDKAFFGEKDYQQLCVIRHAVAALALPVDIEGVATVREEDGLAVSSRNAYLTADERAKAPLLYRTIRDLAAKIAAGESPEEASREGCEALEAAGFGPVDYLACMDGETLVPVTATDIAAGRPARLFVAAKLGRARLIDNVAVPA